MGNDARRWLLRSATALALLAAALTATHLGIRTATVIRPPTVKLPASEPTRSWARTRAGLREVYLEGPPEAIGANQTRLLRDRMIADEERLWSDYERYVPWSLARVGILDASRVRYRHVDRAIPEERRRELAAQSLAFDPDPFAGLMPTYQRMVFLHALYDIALSFERSPLIGCSTFALGPATTADGHVIVARAFDMETDEALDLDKTVFLVREEGAIPFASVAWPGFVGVVTGMNAEGVFLVVHGGRAREPRALGMPVVFSLREVLSRAHNAAEGIALLRAQNVMVSHIVLIADAGGTVAIVERAPGVPAFVRDGGPTTVVTNHFEGPLASDPKNLQVRANTTSLPRAARLTQLVDGLAPRSASPRTALAILRDHVCTGDDACPLGDRRAIDALIATHGVVADVTAGVLWVGIGPHLSGRFVALDLHRLFAPGYDPDRDSEPDTMPEDPILSDGRYERARDSMSRSAQR